MTDRTIKLEDFGRHEASKSSLVALPDMVQYIMLVSVYRCEICSHIGNKMRSVSDM